MSRTFLHGVPVGPVLAWLGRFAIGGRFYCPFHDDARPGGRPSAEIDRNDPSVFHCWSCDRNFSAAQLIAKLTGCTVDEASQRAIAIGGTGAFPIQRARPTLSGIDLEAELVREAERAQKYPVDPVDAFRADRRWLPEHADFARNEWGWQAGYHDRELGRVVLPHRDRVGVLTGLHRRLPPGRCWRHPNERGWCKDGRGRSRFGQLYGVWRLKDVDEIWIVEGEPDTVLAAWHFEPSGIGVVGLPFGDYKPHPEDLELLRGRRVVIAYDDDDTGRRARDRWSAALPGAVTVVSMFDLETVR